MFSLFKLQRNRWFWKSKYYLGSALFNVNKLNFKLQEKSRESKENFSIFRELVRIISGSLLLALFLTVALPIAEDLLLRLLDSSNLLFSKQLLVYAKVLKDELTHSSSTFDQLLTLIASVSGVFIGLYFTAISVVASSIFARVPGNLRDVFLKEKVGNVYIKVLTLVTAISVILLSFKIFGQPPGILNSAFIAILGCVGILSFIPLGRRAFLFFDPTELSNSIFYDLNRNIRLSTISGYRWFDPSFQTAYHDAAAANISTLGTLIEICLKEQQLRSKRLSLMLNKIAYFLRTYQMQRKFIPSDSRWYALVPKYKSWFLQDSSVLTMALQTKTSASPELIPDPYWFEDDVIEISSSVLKSVLGSGDVKAAYEMVDAFNPYFESLGVDLEIKKGFDMVKKIGSSIEHYFDKQPVADVNNEKRYSELALWDAYGLCTMSIAVGFHNLIRDLSVQTISRKIDGIHWLRRKGIYQKEFAPLLLPRLEFIQKRLKFEKQAETRLSSPKWYRRQLVIMNYAELLKEGIEGLLSGLEENFVSRSQSLLTQKSCVLAAHHSQRGLEMCNKVKSHLPRLENLVGSLKDLAIIEELVWPEFDWRSIAERIDNSHDRLTVNLAKCISDLATLQQAESFPDLFGQAYNTVCQECYESMASKKPEKTKLLFPSIFFGALIAHERLKKELADWRPESALGIAVQPIIDILELSGYAKVYSELFEIPEMWDICEELWNKYFKGQKQVKDAIKGFILTYQYRESTLLQIAPRDILRTNWQMQLLKELQNMDLVDEFGPLTPWAEKPKVSHKSSLIRALCGGRYEPHIPAAEIFIITYLLKKPESKEIEFEDKWGLSEAITDEENNENEESSE